MMEELADTARLAVAADLTNLYLVQSQGVVSLHSHRGEIRQLSLGKEDSRHGWIVKQENIFFITL